MDLKITVFSFALVSEGSLCLMFRGLISGGGGRGWHIWNSKIESLWVAIMDRKKYTSNYSQRKLTFETLPSDNCLTFELLFFYCTVHVHSLSYKDSGTVAAGLW